MGRAEDFCFCFGISLLSILFVSVAVAVFAASAAQNYPLIKLVSYDCDASTFALSDETYKISDSWYLLATRGACPLSRRSHERAAGTNAYTADYKYRGCIEFGKNDQKQWADLDRADSAVGYSTNFRSDTYRWSSSGHLSQAGTVFLYVAFLFWGITFCASRTKAAPYLIHVPYLMLVVAFALWLAAIVVIANTSFLDTKAWETYFFSTCRIEAPVGPAYVLGIYIIVSIATFLALVYLMFAYYAFRNDIVRVFLSKGDEEESKSNDDEGAANHRTSKFVARQAVEENSTTFTDRHKTFLDFHHSIYEHAHFMFWATFGSHDDIPPVADIEHGGGGGQLMMNEMDEIPEGVIIEVQVMHVSTSEVYDVAVLSTAKVSELRELVLIKLNEDRGIPGNGEPFYMPAQVSLQWQDKTLTNGAARLHTLGITDQSRLILFLAKSSLD